MTKTYPIEIILSLTTRVLLKHGGFGDMQELAEHVLGHSVWTHEFADRANTDKMQAAVFAQHPTLRNAEPWDKPEAKDITEYLEGYVERAREQFGESLDVESGTAERTESPLASAERLMPGKPVVGVVV